MPAEHVLYSYPFLVSVNYVFFRCFKGFLSLSNLIFLAGELWSNKEKYKGNEKANLRENHEEANDVNASLSVIWAENTFAMFEAEAIEKANEHDDKDYAAQSNCENPRTEQIGLQVR